MRKQTFFSIIVVGISSAGGGCSSPPSQGREPRAAVESPGRASAARPSAAKFTAASNPTTLAGRGQPSLDDKARPAAWVYVDGQAGKFIERDGEPLTQWVVEGPVCASPTFRVEGYEPLLGNPMDFKCVLQAIDSSGTLHDGTVIDGPDGLFHYLRDHNADFHRTLCSKLLGYALGRAEIASDRPLIEQMMSSIEVDSRFANLVVQVVTSPQFQHQRARGEADEHESPALPAMQ